MPVSFSYLNSISNPRNYLFHFLFLFVLHLCIVLFFPQTIWRGNIGNLIYVLTNFFVVLLLFRTANTLKRRGSDLFNAWFLIAAGQAAVLVGDVLFSLIFLLYGKNIFPSMADFFYLLYYPFLFMGITRLSNKKIFKFSIVEFALAGIIITTAAIFILVFLLLPLTNGSLSDPLSFSISLAYPLSDLILLLALVFLLFQNNTKIHPSSSGTFANGLFLLLVIDVLYGSFAYSAEYQSATLIDSIYLLSYIMIGLAGVYQINLGVQPSSFTQSSRDFLTQIRLGITTFAISGQFGLLVAMELIPDLRKYVWWILGGLAVTILLGIVVIITTINENRALAVELQKINEQLEERVRQRTEELEKSRRLLEQQANLDFLTQIPNRAYFVNLLKKEIERRKNNPNNYYLLFLDLDRFKDINDTAGHHIGDELLIKVAQRLRSCVRESDLVARLGGDEFVVLITELVDEQTVQMISARIIERINEPFSIKSSHYKVGVSIGVVSSEYMPDVKSALQNADIAMYAAKNTGRNRIVYFDPVLLTHPEQSEQSQR